MPFGIGKKNIFIGLKYGDMFCKEPIAANENQETSLSVNKLAK